MRWRVFFISWSGKILVGITLSALTSSFVFGADFYVGGCSSRPGPQERIGLLAGASQYFEVYSPRLEVGIFAEFVQKGRKGAFTFFNNSTGEVTFQGKGNYGINYFQPGLVIRAPLFKLDVRPVPYFGVGKGLVISEEFESEPQGERVDLGTINSHSDSLWFSGLALYYNSFLFDVRYSKSFDKYSVYGETLSLAVGWSFDIDLGESILY